MYCRGNPIKYSDPSGYEPQAPCDRNPNWKSTEYEREKAREGLGVMIEVGEYGSIFIPGLEGIGAKKLAAKAAAKAIHGNSLNSKAINYLYHLKDRITKEIVKIGESIRPNKRYTQKALDKMNAEMHIVKSGEKRAIHIEQHEQIVKMKGETEGVKPIYNKNMY